MSKLVLRDVQVVVNGIDLSDHVSNVTVDATRELIDVTGITDDATRNITGRESSSMQVTFFQDFDTGSVDETLQALYAAGTAFLVQVVPTSAAVSSTNPDYSGTFVLPAYSPLSGGIGAAATVDVTFQGA